MKLQIKAVVVILSTFVLGVVLGYLANDLLYPKPPRRISGMRDFDRFLALHERIIDPTKAQQDTVEKILRKNYQRLRNKFQEHQAEIKAILDSIQVELEPFLTEEQKERLRQRREFIDEGRGFPHRMPGEPFPARDRFRREGLPDRPFPPPGPPVDSLGMKEKKDK
jgi:hypothetical protein